MKLCGFPDCGRAHYSQGLCQTHRKQQQCGEELRPIKFQNKARRISDCTGPECNQVGNYGGLCWAHYHQRKASKELRPVRGPRRVPVGCSFDGCDRQSKSRDLCGAHYRQSRTGEGVLRPIHVPTYRYRTGEGYIRLRLPGHPNAGANGSVMEHTKVMAERLGRPLWPDEEVHHRNGVRDDNDPDNLELWTTSHPKGQRVIDKLAWARELLARYADDDLTETT